MTLKGQRPNDNLGVWVDDGPCQTSFVEIDPAFDIGNERPMFVADDGNGYYRPISSFTTVAAAAAGFGGVIGNAQNDVSPRKKVCLYHCGGAEVYLNVATSLSKGDKLKPWLDPDTGAVSQTVYELAAPADPEAFLTVCTDCECAGYPKEHCVVPNGPTDASPTAAKAAKLVSKVKVRFCEPACGCDN